ncbi:MAG: hypothetical protein EBT05_14995, partial [Betaproteobacteria bacterium]|nr:hypothetical protein [Betaproteobacteria bacterium]
YIGIGIKGFLGKLCGLLIQLGESLFEIDEDAGICEADVLNGVGIGSADPDIYATTGYEIGCEVEGFATGHGSCFS